MFEAKFFRKGDLIIEEGATEDTAYIIQKGSVQVFKTDKGRKIPLARLGAGSVIGEMSLLTGEAHATGVEALEDTGVNAISREDFETMLNTNPRSIIPILKEAFRKLIYMNQIAAAFSEKGEGAAAPAAVEAKRGMRLTARTAEAERALKGKEVAVAKTPFNIGRATRDGAFDNIDLRLQDQDPYQLSRTHCSLVYVQNKYYVIDTSSTLGTTVDGVRIGKREALKKVVLEPGRHTLVLGSPNSPYRFELDIPEA